MNKLTKALCLTGVLGGALFGLEAVASEESSASTTVQISDLNLVNSGYLGDYGAAGGAAGGSGGGAAGGGADIKVAAYN